MKITPSKDRQARGVFYTPLAVARRILQGVLAHLPSAGPLTICDPACGDGAFLSEAWRMLAARGGAGHQLLGVDIDPVAVAAAGQTMSGLDTSVLGDVRQDVAPGGEIVLREVACDATEAETDARINWDVRRGDALVGPEWQTLATGPAPPHTFDWRQSFPTLLGQRNDPSAPAGVAAWSAPDAPGGLDAVVGNPPYLNIRRWTKGQSPQCLAFLRRRYRSADGAYDAYVLFLERAYELLRPGGVCGMIVPNKLATLDYARSCRRLLAEQTTLLAVDDLSSLKLFPGANVYPYILIWKKAFPLSVQRPIVTQITSEQQLSQPYVAGQESGVFTAERFQLGARLSLESRVPTCPLQDCAILHSGATGFSAQRLAGQLVEASLDDDLSQAAADISAATINGDLPTIEPSSADNPPESFDFIVSGNIDRYCLQLGDVRFMKRFFRRPQLPGQASLLSAGKRRLYQAPKIVIAGMTRRLEAAWSPGPLALGVQVYAVVEMQMPPLYLLALLNSTLLSHLFRIRFAAKRLGGGYLAINKSQLAQLPIVRYESAPGLAAGLEDLARQRCRLEQEPTDHSPRDAATLDARIDALVYQLYQLTSAEIALVEAASARLAGPR
ncbi:HsdM family class I SAM-dependent methyltransferase [Lignipirellula cremea]|uniref:site-specific DNA-methyltransferase (adenine-specific) n=1 Tax=Lignipirellula cremea TaxID=2528010 RepID=A0A518DQT5_9BACT|nr:Eco57I restriction-modification methylase domain-containing protein [Lignipirellula cremea]QDU94182.1 Type IIS restriction enzyme Eco57I [Lignipirellula cremea]